MEFAIRIVSLLAGFTAMTAAFTTSSPETGYGPLMLLAAIFAAGVGTCIAILTWCTATLVATVADTRR